MNLESSTNHNPIYSDQEGLRSGVTNGIPSYASAFTPTGAGISNSRTAAIVATNTTPTSSTPTCSPLPLSSTTTNGRGSSADSGVRLSSDRDSNASHEGKIMQASHSKIQKHLLVKASFMHLHIIIIILTLSQKWAVINYL